MLVCFYHDYGYFVADDYREYTDLNKIISTLTHNLFDNTHTLRYSRETYFSYYSFKYDTNINSDDETGDHGILGGLFVYNKLMEETRDTSHAFYVAHAIANHNLWVQEKEKNITKYQLYELTLENYKVINYDVTPLLFLLSVVDTIEFIKRYCRYKDSEANKEHNIFPTTLLQYIDIECDRSQITIIANYEALNSRIKKAFLDKDIYEWRKSLLEMEKWVNINIYPISDNKSGPLIIRCAQKAGVA